MLQSDGFRGSDYLEEGGFYAGDDVPENLSIELDRFLQILNEKSDPTTRRSTVRLCFLLIRVFGGVLLVLDVRGLFWLMELNYGVGICFLGLDFIVPHYH